MKIINSRKLSAQIDAVDLYLTSDGSLFLRLMNEDYKYCMLLTFPYMEYYKSCRYENGNLDSRAYDESTYYIMFMAKPDNTMIVEYTTRR